jgi:hypothetical protein
MGLEIGQKMYLKYIYKNLPIISNISSYNHNISLHVRDIYSVVQIFVLLQYYQNTTFYSYAWIHLNIFVMCLLHTTTLQFQIFI